MAEGPRKSESTDADLVEAARAGCQRAFAQLVRRYLSTLRGVVYSLVGQSSGVDDIVQDTLLAAYRSLDRIVDPERFGHWLYTVARRRAIRFRQAQQRQRLVPLREEEPEIIAQVGTQPDPAAIFDRNEALAALHQRLEGLPDDYRLVLELRYWRGLPTRKMAHLLGWPETTVKWRLHKAKQLLQQQLKPREGKEYSYVRE
ncbi:MAG: sigma-70 family RNA polymerase sigma factor [Candidatus Latescibacteria bacterium]|nr:sigma-70 family RNA polymerase sigma factor [Candidatus Latescibacterota bacterium]